MTGFGVYVHVPFCTARCDYCAFATWTDRWHLAEPYIEACRLSAAGVLRGAPPATSVFFGGGTPSLLSAAQIARILEVIPVAPGAEITVECNPETVDHQKLAGYAAAGVTRLSFGVQSMVPHVLASLGRAHDVASVQKAVAAAADAGFGDTYNADLIFGAEGESLSDWAATLDAVLSLDPAPRHVSAYALTVEKGTPLAASPSRHPDPDDLADKYELADERLGEAGFRWYEVSNWAHPGFECRHNQLYWSGADYLGIGAAAHSHRVDPDDGSSRRWWNVRTPDRFIRLVESGEPVEAAGETLPAPAHRLEVLQLAMRTRTGVPAAALPGWPSDPDLVSLVEPAPGDRLVLTRRGRLLANEVALRLEAETERLAPIP